MPYLQREGTSLFFDDIGDGPAVITTHGLFENATYWALPGVAAQLSLHHRVVSLDMRGHGRTRTTAGADGFDVATMGADIDAVADHLGIERFHLLTHATGGMVGVRYAMARGDRLLSLVLTDTSSATMVGPREGFEQLAQLVEGATWPELHAVLRQPLAAFLSSLDEHPDSAAVWQIVHRCFELGDPSTLARFIRMFYTDPDPQIDGLRRIPCPTLVVVGEHDRALMKPSRLMADNIPDAELFVVPGAGHMTAIEAPQQTAWRIDTHLRGASPDRQ